jgi:hypothetical protein
MQRPVLAAAGAGFALLAAGLLGCGRSGPHTIPISGKVLYRGQPLTQGEVRYVPLAGGARQARGTLDSNGEFQLTTFALNDGALPGSYRIAVISLEPHTGEPGRDESQQAAAPRTIPARKSRVPERYASAETSGLTDNVDDNHPGYREYSLAD